MQLTKAETNRWLQCTPDYVDTMIAVEQLKGERKFGNYNSMHEAYAVIREELDEFWESVKADEPDPEELLQVCATTRRALLELCKKARLACGCECACDMENE